MTIDADQAGDVRDKRLRLGLSQQEVAELAGCSIAMVRLLEQGWRPKESPTLERVVEVLEEAERKAR